ncbi:thiamine pyrophosphate-binding protein [Erythrobacter sp. SN021]|uniref:thiamine pyrophosphate-binding protein n=1 Tax=Erythrobacter sp. SN021 TaxID=2912574 RepID=UPI001F2217C5|nr:thiamine pyrophosphate-binding protein [Erythrobacter sp. SN021]MCF8882093.1 thiamine pyrophosphate-binding protein [Erythrobacter sp. SN021]
MTAPDTPQAAQLLIDCLTKQGCDRIFTVPGESFLQVLDGLGRQDAIDVVTCRQEGGVAFMACADGAMTGRPGVAFVTRGPGATNASIGVHVAMQDSQPMILFVGDVDSEMRDREGFQEVDFSAFFGPIAKWAARIDSADRIPEYVARAYATAMSGRPGPVVLALPEDMLSRDTDSKPRPCVARPAQAPCPDAMQAMMALIADAASPIAIIGGAGWNAKARENFQLFAERLGIPVATAFRRQDAISPSSPVYAGNLGYGPNPKLVERVKSADLVLAIGARLGEATTDGYTVPPLTASDRKLVHVHPDANEPNSVYPADLAICASMDEFAESAALWDQGDAIDFDAGREAHAEWEAWATAHPNDHALDMGQAVQFMRDTLPADTIICNGAGNFSGWWHRYWRYEGLPTQLAPTCGAMGYGVPAAVSAALRFPQRTVVAVAGDGDFLMNGQELATAVQHGANLIVIVVDNSAYGTIRMHQEREFPGEERISATRLANPDFAALANAFGGWSARAATTQEFKDALVDAQGRGGLRLIHCTIDIEQLAASGASVSGLRNR